MSGYPDYDDRDSYTVYAMRAAHERRRWDRHARRRAWVALIFGVLRRWRR
jgi:hypothetical protein